MISECVPTFKIHGKGVHVDGMSHECPKCSTTAQAIASNHTKSIHGKAIVLEGDKTTCGASFIASQGLASIDGRKEYESNITVDTYDKDGNSLGNYRLIDKPSNLSASIATPMPIPFPGALSIPRVPSGVRPYPFTNIYDLQNPKNPFGKKYQDLFKKISNTREQIHKRNKELIEDDNKLSDRGVNLPNWATKRGHRAIIRVQENNLRKKEKDYDENCQFLA